MRERRIVLVRAHLRCRMEINERRRYKTTRGGGISARGPAASADLWISSGLIGGRVVTCALFEFRAPHSYAFERIRPAARRVLRCVPESQPSRVLRYPEQRAFRARPANDKSLSGTRRE